MQISEVQINLIKHKDGLIGFANLVINKNFYLSSIAIHKKLSSTGYRLTYPKKDGFNLFHPINRKTSKSIEQAIFNKLKEVMKKVKNDRYNSNSDSSWLF